MISETFSAQRFGGYFKYDLRQLWHNNGKAAFLLGGISVICYMICVVFSLVFKGSWQTPGVAARIFFFYLGAIALVLYQTRTYGFLTRKQEGQAWLMLPASTLEKFLSMLIITLIVVPLAYVCSYFAFDTLIGLVDKTTGGPILGSWGDVKEAVDDALSSASEEGFHFNLAAFAVPVVLQMIANLLYFLLCGICFKKWKIAGGIGILIASSFVLVPLLSSFVARYWAPALSEYDYSNNNEALADLLNQIVGFGTVVDVLLVAGLAAGIFYRLKTLKH